MKKALTIMVLLLLANIGYALETVVVGDVYDKQTLQPIENANVYFKGTRIGCATNDEGTFLVRADLDKSATLIVSAVGYKKKRFTIEPGSQSGIQVELEQSNAMLTDLLVVPGENPALALMERVRHRRLINDLSNNSAVSYEMAEERQLWISRINSNHLRRRLWKNLSRQMITASDSTYLLPMMVSERRYRRQGRDFTPITQAKTQSVVLTDDNLSAIIDVMNEPLNFYQQSLSILGKQFISPLSSMGNSHYDYYLADSVEHSTGKLYEVHFRSKNPYTYTFNGTLLIDSASCALRVVDASVPSEVAVNYLRSMRVYQSFAQDNSLAEEFFSTSFDVAAHIDTTNRVFPAALILRHLKQPGIEESETERAAQPFHHQLLAGADSREEQQLMVDSMAKTYIDSLNHEPIMKMARYVAYVFTTGNLSTGTCIDVGNVVELIGGFPFEGFHIALPFATNEKLWKNVELSAYLAYGFKDHAYKGKGQIRVKLPTDRRHLFGAYYWDHYNNSELSPIYFKMRENDIFYGDKDFMYMILESVLYTKTETHTYARQKEFKVWSENEWNDYLSTTLDVNVGKLGYGSPMVGYNQMPMFSYKSLQAGLRLGFHETKVDFFMRRHYGHSRYPVVHFLAEMGSYKTDAMRYDRMYGRLSLLVSQTVGLQMFGKLDYSVIGGVVLGKVPYPFLETFAGNPTFAYDRYKFSLMDHYQYGADRFLYGFLTWDMQGLLFNRIPGIQRLHLRELIEAKIAWGMLSDKHRQVVPLPEGMSSLRVPYVELGVGIGNILQVANVFAVFRLTHNTPADNALPWWGIRVCFSFM